MAYYIALVEERCWTELGRGTNPNFGKARALKLQQRRKYPGTLPADRMNGQSTLNLNPGTQVPWTCTRVPCRQIKCMDKVAWTWTQQSSSMQSRIVRRRSSPPFLQTYFPAHPKPATVAPPRFFVHSLVWLFKNLPQRRAVSRTHSSVGPGSRRPDGLRCNHHFWLLASQSKKLWQKLAWIEIPPSLTRRGFCLKYVRDSDVNSKRLWNMKPDRMTLVIQLVIQQVSSEKYSLSPSLEFHKPEKWNLI